MNTANEWISEIIALADGRGWMVTGWSSVNPCSITLTDRHGSSVTVRDEKYGLTIKQYVGQLTAEPGFVPDPVPA